MAEQLAIPGNAIETEAGYFWLKNEIVHIYNKPTIHLKLEVALLNIEMSRRTAAGVSRPLLIDMTEIKSIERAAREAFAAAGTPQYVTAVALITRSGLSRVLGNFFIGFNRATVPTRLFSDCSSARTWLQNYLPV